MRAFGQLLHDLRSEASRIARSGHVDWWVERTDKGVCFEDDAAKQSFLSVCENLGVQHYDPSTVG